MNNLYFGKIAAYVALCAILLVAAGSSPVHAQQTGPGGVPGGNSGGAVASVFGRTGAVVAATGDYTAAQVTNAAATNATNNFSSAQAITSPDPQFSLTDGSGHIAQLHAVNGFVYYSDNDNGLGFTVNSNVFFAIPNGSVYGFLPGTFQYDAPRAGFSSTATGIIQAGNGTYGDTSGWLQLSALGNGATGNTDLRGHVTLVGGTGSYTFSKTYTVAPTCVATDSTTAAPVKVSSSTASLTLTGTGTDVLNYICVD